jgi:hypothetical protein
MLNKVLWIALVGALIASSSVQAQRGGARAQMERCVDRVLTQSAREKAPEGVAVRAVLSTCEGVLRDTLIEAMNTGEARGMCASVEACMEIARKRTADQARDAYRARLARQ